MIINLVVVAMVLGLGALWLSRGFFSALINLLSVLLAAGVAFAAWEPLAQAILDNTDERSFMQGAAWSLALAGPFILALGIFRAILDGTIRANVKLNQTVDYAGGGLCGAISGFVSAGVAVLAIGFLRMDAGLWKTDEASQESGYLNVIYNSNGSINKGDDLWIPADRIVALIYGKLSQTTLRTEENLGDLYPDLAYVPATLRYNYGMGKGRNTTRSKDVDVIGRYTVAKGKKLPAGELLADQWYTTPQAVTNFDKVMDSGGNETDSVVPGSYIEGYIIKFNASARELGGDTKISVGNAQVRILAHNPQTLETITLFPIAVAAQAEAAKPAYQRFRFDGKEIFLASVGGASEAYFGFDFIMPPGFEAKWMYVKNIRFPLGTGKTEKPLFSFDSPTDRDDAITKGRLPYSKNQGGPLDTTNVRVIRWDPSVGFNNDSGIQVSNALPQVFNKMVVRDMICSEDNKIVSGDQRFSPDDLKNFAQEKTLRVDSFETTSDTTIVKVDVSQNSVATWLQHPNAAQDDTKPPSIVDTAGVRYDPVGFIHKDDSTGFLRIRYETSAPITQLKDLPTVSRSKPKDTLTLVYRVSAGVKIQYFTVGNKAIVEWKPTVEANRGR